MTGLHKFLRIAFGCFAGSALFALAAPAAAAGCADLAKLDLGQGKVTSAAVVAPGAFEQPAAPFGPPPGVGNAVYKNLPAFCRVQATLTPTADSDIKVEVWLPAKGWNGKFVGIGNGIWAGQLSYSQLADPLSKGYAVATTDTGHSGSGLTAEWAVGHPEKLVDFGHRAVHLMTVTGKAAVKALYGKAPKLSFWNACSTGGRQGLMEAYRYPDDYDAISAMAPANPMTSLMTQSMWANWVTKREPGAALTPAVLGTVHAAVIRQCDKLDGLEDGLVARPDACNFDPAALLCKPGENGSCLTQPQVNAVRGLYDGVRGGNGQWLLPGWPRGAEMQLAALVSGPQPFPVAYDYFHLLTYGTQQGWDWKGMEYTAGLADARQYGAGMLDVPYDGLAPFFARGGRLLLSHGWTDGLIPANNTLAFYHSLYGALPLASAQNQLRLFMVPGMDHCSGGDGTSEFDTLGTIDTWASSGLAPNRIVATRPTALAAAMPGTPPAPPRAPLSRPLCPYPMVPEYKGSGDTAVETSFSCAVPKS
ncbi:MAG: tannase/feruloyl esterase family alpha/beta hydrolase [Candidatus Andeanibacterium colombiense]|uniref:Tannase/feruloyl esterase family alpha/beta hydrolase n=1 Tax=Candidatus Andeanibacterium colombiense TaxID=3121345 RepID=A0AAJ6BMN4_9SPHN|nr:MAG: tannase/feruloyl esterase family alpha/beta hydrolase [Sphingomonadaceae bacterium]